jgi:hypothetical protein
MTPLRALPAGLLAAAAAVLAGASKLAELGARRLAPPSRPPSKSSDEPAPAPPPVTLDDVVVHPTPTAPEADAPDVLDQGEVEQGLEVAADVVEQGLDRVPGVEADADAALDATLPPEPDTTGVVADLPPTDASIIDDQARTHESHIAELADRNASEVVRGIQDLSTEELGQLFDYESAHRKRKTVLQAIERAAAPTGEETVFSTESADYREGDPPL